MTKIVLTYEDFAALPDDGKRYELHEGELSVTPAPSLRHQVVIGNLFLILAPHVQDYIARLILATHPDGPYATNATNQFIRWGASPRGAQTIALASKVRALLDSRFNVSFEDVRRVYLPALRHRVVLNFEAQSEGLDTDKVLLEILEKVSEKADS